MRHRICTALVLLVAALAASPAQAHLERVFPAKANAKRTLSIAKVNYGHVAYVCKRGTGKVKARHCRGMSWLARVIADREQQVLIQTVGYWASVQIHYATLIAQSAGKDPWPNCPDPYFGGGSWYDTVACENRGSWLDSPGYYRCGLQFDPGWELYYGRKFCP